MFATGGLGGVHRGARDSWDESADLPTLAATGITVVCAGVKSILDVAATLERLETLNVTVLGYGTDRFPGFYLADSGHPAPWRVDTPDGGGRRDARAGRARPGRAGDRGGQPAARGTSRSIPALHDRVLAESLAEAARRGIRGKAVTPFLLDRLHRETGGATLEANVALVRRNAELAARIAAAAVAVRT